MGSCGSTICTDTKQKKTEESEKVKVHRRRNKVTFKPDNGCAPRVSNNVEILDCNSRNNSLSDKSSSSSPLKSGKDIDFKRSSFQSSAISGTDTEVCKATNLDKVFSVREKQPKVSDDNEAESKLDQIESSNAPRKKQSEGRSVPHFSYTVPPPRPSPWKEVYLTFIKPKEERAEQNMKSKTKRRCVKKKQVDREKAQKIRVLTKLLAKKIDSTRKKASSTRHCNSPADQDILFEPATATLFWFRRSSSTSVTSASTSSSASQSSSDFSSYNDDSSEEPSIDGLCYKGYDDSSVIAAQGDLIRTLKSLGCKKDVRQARGLFVRKRNKVSPM